VQSFSLAVNVFDVRSTAPYTTQAASMTIPAWLNAAPVADQLCRVGR
jgi:hypothetical protein